MNTNIRTLLASLSLVSFMLVPVFAVAQSADGSASVTATAGMNLPANLPCQAEMKAYMKKYGPAIGSMPTPGSLPTPGSVPMLPASMQGGMSASTSDNGSSASMSAEMNSSEGIALRNCLKNAPRPTGVMPSIKAMGTAGASADGSASASASMSASATGAEGSCPMLTRSLRKGSRGADVKALQSYLISVSLLADGSASGYFGSLTASAVESWQASHDISSTGSVGRMTRAALAKCDN